MQGSGSGNSWRPARSLPIYLSEYIGNIDRGQPRSSGSGDLSSPTVDQRSFLRIAARSAATARAADASIRR
jgi:hypothetical protein